MLAAGGAGAPASLRALWLQLSLFRAAEDAEIDGGRSHALFHAFGAAGLFGAVSALPAAGFDDCPVFTPPF